ncbi:MAG: hypothetical protein WA347_05450 [Rhabdochlamydiaceae bacterium]|jgi:hypothetical protein
MNRSKRSQTQKIQKQMAKEVRNAQGRSPLPESRQYSDELTAKEMLKKFPKSEAKKKEESLSALEKKISIKKKSSHKITSKRTTPGLVSADSPPAHIHREGKRWTKTLIEQNLAERAIQAHKGTRGLVKK